MFWMVGRPDASESPATSPDVFRMAMVYAACKTDGTLCDHTSGVSVYGAIE
jgi:hypothetical protein